VGYFNVPIQGTPRSQFVGDQVYVMIGPHNDVDGNLWPTGTEYVNGAIVIDPTLPGSPQVQTAVIGGLVRTFMGRPTRS